MPIECLIAVRFLRSMAEQSKATQYLTVGLVPLSILLWLFWLNQITLFPGRIIQGPEIEQYAYVAATFLGIIAGITAVGGSGLEGA